MKPLYLACLVIIIPAMFLGCGTNDEYWILGATRGTLRGDFPPLGAPTLINGATGIEGAAAVLAPVLGLPLLIDAVTFPIALAHDIHLFLLNRGGSSRTRTGRFYLPRKPVAARKPTPEDWEKILDGTMTKLGSSDAFERRQAVSFLAAAGTGAIRAVPVLIKALGDKDGPVRKQAALALAAVGRPAMAGLAKGLKSESHRIRAGSARALGKAGKESLEVLPALVDALDDGNERVRSAAVEALGRLGPGAGEAVPRLIRALSDPVVGGGGRQGPGEDRERSRGGRTGPVEEPCVPRSGIPVGLSPGAGGVRARTAPAVPITAALGDPDRGSRREAVKALARIGREARAAVEALRLAKMDGDPVVRHFAGRALKEIEGE